VQVALRSEEAGPGRGPDRDPAPRHHAGCAGDLPARCARGRVRQAPRGRARPHRHRRRPGARGGGGWGRAHCRRVLRDRARHGHHHRARGPDHPRSDTGPRCGGRGVDPRANRGEDLHRPRRIDRRGGRCCARLPPRAEQGSPCPRSGGEGARGGQLPVGGVMGGARARAGAGAGDTPVRPRPSAEHNGTAGSGTRRSMTITEKILAAHSGRDHVVPGEIVDVELDLVICHEITTPPAIRMMHGIGVTRVFDPDRVLVTPDHFVPNKDILTAELSRRLREWVKEQGIPHYFEIGNHGIYAALAPEKGFIRPGMTVVCGDSHTTTLGALGCFAAGVGSTDLAAALATGRLWFRVPESMRIEVRGRLPFGVYAKDLILYVISRIGVDGARYRAMEWAGEA